MPLVATAESATLRLTSEEQAALASWPDLVQRWGWRLSGGVAATGEVTVALPALHGRLLGAPDFRAYLRQLLGAQGAAASPGCAQQVLAAAACRGAVMFGDSLATSQGQEMVGRLEGTRLCFQCAHGRPTMAPLVDLPAVAALQPPGRTASQQGTAAGSLSQLKTRLQHLIKLAVEDRQHTSLDGNRVAAEVSGAPVL